MLAYQSLKRRRRNQWVIGPDGMPIPAHEAELYKATGFIGRGTVTTSPFRLDADSYKMRYVFPTDVKVKVDLLSMADGETETLLLASGGGVKGFQVTARGDYCFHVEADDSTTWEIEFMRLALPSQRHS